MFIKQAHYRHKVNHDFDQFTNNYTLLLRLQENRNIYFLCVSLSYKNFKPYLFIFCKLLNFSVLTSSSFSIELNFLDLELKKNSPKLIQGFLNLIIANYLLNIFFIRKQFKYYLLHILMK